MQITSKTENLHPFPSNWAKVLAVLGRLMITGGIRGSDDMAAFLRHDFKDLQRLRASRVVSRRVANARKTPL